MDRGTDYRFWENDCAICMMRWTVSGFILDRADWKFWIKSCEPWGATLPCIMDVKAVEGEEAVIPPVGRRSAGMEEADAVPVGGDCIMPRML